MGAVALAYFRFLRPSICVSSAEQSPAYTSVCVLSVSVFWTRWKYRIWKAEVLINNKPFKHHLTSDCKKWMIISSTGNEVFFFLFFFFAICIIVALYNTQLICVRDVSACWLFPFLVRWFLSYSFPVVGAPGASQELTSALLGACLPCAVPTAKGRWFQFLHLNIFTVFLTVIHIDPCEMFWRYAGKLQVIEYSIMCVPSHCY